MPPSLATRFARHRWRRVLVAYTALALGWTAFGPLPWVILEFAPANLFAASAVDDATHDSTHDADAPHHHDGSAIPGSPTHPVDHDCFQCEVILLEAQLAVLVQNEIDGFAVVLLRELGEPDEGLVEGVIVVELHGAVQRDRLLRASIERQGESGHGKAGRESAEKCMHGFLQR